MITYNATLDVPQDLAHYLARLLHAERVRRATRRGRRALTLFNHAVLVLRWFRDATPVHRLATDNRISIATAYRYLHEGITVLAAEQPDLTTTLARRRATGDTHVTLDGTLIHSDRVAATTTKTKGRNAGATVHLWYSGKHRDFGGNIQFLATTSGFPLWCSDVEPGITNDLTAAREQHLIGALTAAAAQGLPTLTDKAYHSAGIGIHTPIKKPQGATYPLHPDNRTYNTLITRLRCLGERAAAVLKTRWKALRHITLCPYRIGSITQAALVLTHYEHQGRY